MYIVLSIVGVENRSYTLCNLSVDCISIDYDNYALLVIEGDTNAYACKMGVNHRQPMIECGN